MIKINDFVIGEKPYVIAEVGNNHLGDIELAHKTLDAAADAGVSAVKFQMFEPSELITSSEPVLKHVPENTIATQRERFKKMCLSKEDFAALAEHAKQRSVTFLCTPFDRKSADFLDELVPAFKIASGDATNYQLIEYVASKNKPMMVSTGLCTQTEVDELVKRLPNDRTVIFHCVGSYPTPDEDVCLSLVPHYISKYNIPVGYSDHTIDLVAPTSAIALGAIAIEKHFILDKSLPGGDRDLSLTGVEMKQLVENANRVFNMIGETPRKVRPSEYYGREKLRRSPYTKRKIKAGEQINLDDIVYLRPEIEGAYTQDQLKNADVITALHDCSEETPILPNTFKV